MPLFVSSRPRLSKFNNAFKAKSEVKQVYCIDSVITTYIRIYIHIYWTILSEILIDVHSKISSVLYFNLFEYIQATIRYTRWV